MSFIFVLNHLRDVPLIAILYKTSPWPFKVILSNFKAIDEYQWPKKRKYIDSYFNDVQIESIKNIFGDDLVNCTSLYDFKKITNDTELCISRGREFFVLKQFAKKNIAISSDRCYLSRILDILPIYNDSIKIIFDSEVWINKKICEYIEMTSGSYPNLMYDYDYLETHKDKFEFVDVLGEINNLFLSKIGKDSIKENFNIDKNKKIAFLSLRSADPEITLYKNSDAFFNVTLKMIKEFKKNNYTILSRRRLGTQDIIIRNSSPEISRFQEIKQYIDLELNGYGEFPGDLWRAMCISDVLLLPDISSIADIEAVLCKCPIYMPLNECDKNRVNFVINKLSPRFQDLMRKNLIFSDIENFPNIDYFNRMDNFSKFWYNTNIKKFWEIVYNFLEEK